jgi:hypothetical protein
MVSKLLGKYCFRRIKRMFHRETMKVVKDDKRRLPPTTDLDRINSSWDVFLTQRGD